MSPVAVKFKREHQLLIGVAVFGLAGIGVYYSYLVRPLMGSALDLERSIKTEEAKLAHIEQMLGNEPQLHSEHDQLAQSMESLRAAMPPEQELASVIEQLSTTASLAGLKLQTIFPQRSLESFKLVAGLEEGQGQKKLYKEIPIQIEALSGFHQLGDFLSRMEHGKQPMHLKSLRVSQNFKDGRRHSIEMVVIAYFAASDGKSAGEAKALVGTAASAHR